jgi:hypothetical protein
MINSVNEFVETAKNLDNDAIYDLFEYDTSDAVRDEIYALVKNENEPEPMRAAMHILGFVNY